MAKVTPLRAGGATGKAHGTFHCKSYNIFDDEDLEQYSDLRNRAADPANGIKIETMREYSRKVVTTDGMGDTQVTTTKEEIILVVHYWEKPVVRKKGDSDEEIADARSAITPG